MLGVHMKKRELVFALQNGFTFRKMFIMLLLPLMMKLNYILFVADMGGMFPESGKNIYISDTSYGGYTVSNLY